MPGVQNQAHVIRAAAQALCGQVSRCLPLRWLPPPAQSRVEILRCKRHVAGVAADAGRRARRTDRGRDAGNRSDDTRQTNERMETVMEQGRFKRDPSSGTGRVRAFLASTPGSHSVSDIAAAAGLTRTQVLNMIWTIRQDKDAWISGWRPDAEQRYWIGLYSWGSEPDVPKPPPFKPAPRARRPKVDAPAVEQSPKFPRVNSVFRLGEV